MNAEALEAVIAAYNKLALIRPTLIAPSIEATRVDNAMRELFKLVNPRVMS